MIVLQLFKNIIKEGRHNTDLLDSYSPNQFKTKQKLEDMIHNHVDINSKSDGVISFNEFKYNEDLKIGDIVEVLIEKQEDKTGQLILSHRRARVLRAWEKVNDALANDQH